MDRDTEIELARELIELQQSGSAFLDEQVERNPVAAYRSADQFMRERERIFKALPQPLAHSSELPQADSFIRRMLAGLPILLTRDRDGQAHAFLNVCRHRGTRLVDDERGCKQRFVCPYHAWTWNNRGELIGVPHREQGFPDLESEDFALRRVGCIERHGWLWVSASQDPIAFDEDLQLLSREFDWFGADQLQLLHAETQTRTVNWKLLVEGGIEAYHFRVAHRHTIAPYFEDNLSSYCAFGPHLRSILARKSLPALANEPVDTWRLRDHAQVLYSVFPANQLLVQSDHVAWIRLEPLSATSTQISLNSLVPTERTHTDDDLAHWRKNHAITLTTLNEDFDIGESIQAGIESGANDHFTFGRFEGALAAFNKSVNRYVLQADR